jgi:hypothetical protein
MKKQFEDLKTFAAVRLDQNMKLVRNALIEKAVGRPRARFFFLFVPALIGSVAVAATTILLSVEDNNSTRIVNNLGGIWGTYTDLIDGGNSEVWPPASTACENKFQKSAPGYGNRGYAVRIYGTIGKNKPWGFLGANTYLSDHAVCPMCLGRDISCFKGIRFKMKGSIENGRLYCIIPFEGDSANRVEGRCLSRTGNDDYQADITGYIRADWQTVNVQFRKKFKQPEWTEKRHRFVIDSVLKDANQIKWRFSGARGAKIDFWIDDIEFY